MFAYVVSGLTVSSDLALPGLIAAPTDIGAGHIAGGGGSDPDVVIAAGTVPIALDDAVAKGPNWQMAEGRFLVAIPASSACC